MNMQTIPVTVGTGTGDTALAAFDAALYSAGIANYNLITLSSVIPEGFIPEVKEVNLNDQEYGNRLYVVMASHSELEMGKEAWAGLGWVVTEKEPVKGLFVEHHGASEQEVINLINESLSNMVKYRPDKFGLIQYKTVGLKCSGHPVCALVAAVYKSEGWK